MVQKLRNAGIYLIIALLSSCSPSGRPENITLKIIQTSDVHGLIFPFDFINDSPAEGSLARVHGFVRQEREKSGQEVILLDNGDILQGQPLVYYYNFVEPGEDHILTLVMNYMGYDAATIGNHDIEAGKPVYERVIAHSGFPWLAANIVRKGTDAPWFEPYTVIDVRGVRVAVMGLVTPMIPEWLPEILWEGMEFREMVPEASRWMDIIMEKEDPDLVIGLFHEGLGIPGEDSGDGRTYYDGGSAEVAALVPGFDIVLTGHDHRVWNLVLENSDGQEVLVMGPGSHARQVAVATVELVYDHSSGKYLKGITGEIVSMSGFTPDEGMMKEFGGHMDAVREYASQRIGEFSSSVSSRDAMFGSSAFVDIIHRLQMDLTGAGISFAAPLSFDAIIDKGDIRVRDLFSLYRFENYLYTMELYGSEIKDYLEYSYGNWFNTMESGDDLLLRYRGAADDSPIILDSGGTYRLAGASFDFDSAAGIDYTVDVSMPAGQRVTVLRMSSGEPFDADMKYSVAINSYRGSGGGGHLEQGAGIPREEFSERILGSTDRDMRHYLMQWIAEREVVDPEPLDNWEVIPGDWWLKAREREMPLLFPR